MENNDKIKKIMKKSELNIIIYLFNKIERCSRITEINKKEDVYTVSYIEGRGEYNHGMEETEIWFIGTEFELLDIPIMASKYPKEYLDCYFSKRKTDVAKIRIKHYTELLNSIIKEVKSLETAYEHAGGTTIKKMLDEKLKTQDNIASNLERRQNELDEIDKKIELWNSLCDKNG